jgi:hypothetical protein
LANFRQNVTDYVLDINFGSPVTISGIKLKAAPPADQSGQWLTIRHNGFIIKAKGPAIMYTLPIDHQVEMQVSYVDSHGNLAAVDGPVRWAASAADLVTVTADATDSTLCEVVPLGPIGQVQITATADVDLGAGVKPLITTCDISLVAGEAVAGTIAPVGESTPINPPIVATS